MEMKNLSTEIYLHNKINFCGRYTLHSFYAFGWIWTKAGGMSLAEKQGDFVLVARVYISGCFCG